jgi:hypothetical protein
MKHVFWKSSLKFLPILLLAGCFGSSNEEVAQGTFGFVMKPVTRVNMEIEAGTINNRVAVRVTDDAGDPVREMQVLFTQTTSTDLSIDMPLVLTDKDGIAQTTLKAQNKVDEVAQVSATLSTISGVVNTFRFKAIPGSPPYLADVIFKNPPAIAKASVSTGGFGPITLQLLDQFGRPFEPYNVLLPDGVTPDPEYAGDWFAKLELEGVDASLVTYVGDELIDYPADVTDTTQDTITFSSYIRYARATAPSKVAVRGCVYRQGPSNPAPELFKCNESDILNIQVDPNVPRYVISVLPGQTFENDGKGGFKSLATAVTGPAADQPAGENFDIKLYIVDEAYNLITHNLTATGTPGAFSPAPTFTLNPATAAPFSFGTTTVRANVTTMGTYRFVPNKPSNVYSSMDASMDVSHQSSSFVVTTGVPKKLTWTVEPSGNYVAGQSIFGALNANISATFLDEYNNPVTAAAASGLQVTMELYDEADTSCDGTALVTGSDLSGHTPSTVALTNYVDFTALKYNKTGRFRFRVTSTGMIPTSCSTSFVTLSPGPPTKVFFAKDLNNIGGAFGYPISGSAGASLNPTSGPIRMYLTDANNNPWISDTTYKLRVFNSTCSTEIVHTDTTPSTTYDNVAGGVSTLINTGNATFSTFNIRRAGTYRIVARAETTVSSVPQSFESTCSAGAEITISSGTADHLFVAQAPSVGSATADGTPGNVGSGNAGLTVRPIVHLRDVYGNVVAQTRTYTLTAHTTSCSGAANTEAPPIRDGYVVNNNADGRPSFSSFVFRRAGNFAFKVAASGSPAVNEVCLTGSALTIAAGAANKVLASTEIGYSAPTVGIAGQDFAATPVKAEITDQYGNIVTSPAQNLVLKAFHTSGCSANEIIPGGSAANDLAPDSVTKRIPSSPAWVVQKATSGGRASFDQFITYRSGTMYVQVRDAAATLSSTSSPCLPITIYSGAPNNIVQTAPTGNVNLTADNTLGNVSFNIRDQWHNLATVQTPGAPLTMTLEPRVASCSGLTPGAQEAPTPAYGDTKVSGSTPWSNTTTSGSISFPSMRYVRAEAFYIYAQVGAVALCSTTAFTVSAGNPSAIGILQQPPTTDIVAGNAFAPAVTVRLLDAYQNAVNLGSYTTKAEPSTNNCVSAIPNVGFSGGNAIAPTAGLYNFTPTQTKAGNYKLLLTATNGTTTRTACSDQYKIVPKPADHLTFTGQPSGTQTAGANITSIRVEVRDIYENVVNNEMVGGVAAIRSLSLEAFSGIHCTSALPVNHPMGNPALPAPTVANATDGMFNVTAFNYRRATPSVYLKATSIITQDGSATQSGCVTAPFAVQSAAPGLIAYKTGTSVDGTVQTAGVNFSPAPVLELTDIYGNKVDNVASGSYSVKMDVHGDDACGGVHANNGTALSGHTQNYNTGTKETAAFNTLAFTKASTGPTPVQDLSLKATVKNGATDIVSACLPGDFQVKPNTNTLSSLTLALKTALTVPGGALAGDGLNNVEYELRDSYGNWIGLHPSTAGAAAPLEVEMGLYSNNNCATEIVNSTNGTSKSIRTAANLKPKVNPTGTGPSIGLAVFTDVRITKSGSNFYGTKILPSGTIVCSATPNISPNVLMSMSVSPSDIVEPTNSYYVVDSPPVKFDVSLKDTYGNTASGPNYPLRLAAHPDAACATPIGVHANLDGTVTAPTVTTGTASFASYQYKAIGNVYFSIRQEGMVLGEHSAEYCSGAYNMEAGEGVSLAWSTTGGFVKPSNPVGPPVGRTVNTSIDNFGVTLRDLFGNPTYRAKKSNGVIETAASNMTLSLQVNSSSTCGAGTNDTLRSWSTSPSIATAIGTKSMTAGASAAEATWSSHPSNPTMRRAGSYYMKVTSGTHLLDGAGILNSNAGAACSDLLTWNPDVATSVFVYNDITTPKTFPSTNVTAGATWVTGQIVAITADAYGNASPAPGRTITLTPYSDATTCNTPLPTGDIPNDADGPGDGNGNNDDNYLSGNSSGVFGAGQSQFTFTNLKYRKSGVVYWRAEADSVLSPYCSTGGMTIVSDGPNRISLTTQFGAAQSVKADLAMPAIEGDVIDKYGNIATQNKLIELVPHQSGADCSTSVLTDTVPDEATGAPEAALDNGSATTSAGHFAITGAKYRRAGVVRFKARVQDAQSVAACLTNTITVNAGSPKRLNLVMIDHDANPATPTIPPAYDTKPDTSKINASEGLALNPEVVISDLYGNINTSLSAGQTFDVRLKAQKSSCTAPVDDTNDNDSGQSYISFASPYNLTTGTAPAVTLNTGNVTGTFYNVGYRRSGESFYIQAYDNSGTGTPLTDSECFGPYSVADGPAAFARLHKSAGAFQPLLVANSQYLSEVVTAHAATYDVWGNYIGNTLADWEVTRVGSNDPLSQQSQNTITGASSTWTDNRYEDSANMTYNGQPVGDGQIRIKAWVSGITNPIDIAPIDTVFQLPEYLEVELVRFQRNPDGTVIKFEGRPLYEALPGNQVKAGQTFGLRITAKRVGGTTTVSYNRSSQPVVLGVVPDPLHVFTTEDILDPRTKCAGDEDLVSPQLSTVSVQFVNGVGYVDESRILDIDAGIFAGPVPAGEPTDNPESPYFVGIGAARIKATINNPDPTPDFFTNNLSVPPANLSIIAGPTACLYVSHVGDLSNTPIIDEETPDSQGAGNLGVNLGILRNLKLGNYDRFGNYVGATSGTWTASKELVGRLLENTTGSTNSFRTSRIGAYSLKVSTGTCPGVTCVERTYDFSVTGVTQGTALLKTNKNADGGVGGVLSSNEDYAHYYYDTLSPTNTIAAATWNTTTGKSWVRTNRGGMTATWPHCATTTADSCRDTMPRNVHIVANSAGVDIIDGTSLRAWMRLRIGTGMALDSDYGAPRAVRAVNGKVFVGMRTVAGTKGALVIFDFAADRLLRFTYDSGGSKIWRGQAWNGSAGGLNSLNSVSWTEVTTTGGFNGKAFAAAVYSIGVQALAGADVLAIGYKGGLQTMRVANSNYFGPNDATGPTIGVSSVSHPNLNVLSIDFAGPNATATPARAPRLYYAVDTVGVKRITLAADYSFNGSSPVVTYANELSSKAVGSVSVVEDLSAETTGAEKDNILYVGTQSGLNIIHEDDTNTRYQAMTFEGSGVGPMNQQVLLLNGTNQVQSGSIPTNSFPVNKGMVELTFRPDSSNFPSASTLFFRGSGGLASASGKDVAGSMGLEINSSGHLNFFIRATSLGSSLVQLNNADQSLALTAGTRHHVAVGWEWTNEQSYANETVASNPETLHLYMWVNGQYINEAILASTPTTNYYNGWKSAASGSTGYILGSKNMSDGPNVEFFRGALDEFRIADSTYAADQDFTVPSGLSSADDVDGLGDADDIWAFYKMDSVSGGAVPNELGSPAGTSLSLQNGATISNPLLFGLSNDMRSVSAVKVKMLDGNWNVWMAYGMSGAGYAYYRNAQKRPLVDTGFEYMSGLIDSTVSVSPYHGDGVYVPLGGYFDATTSITGDRPDFMLIKSSGNGLVMVPQY